MNGMRLFIQNEKTEDTMRDYNVGIIGVLDLAAAIDRGEDGRTSPDFLAHVTEVLEGIIRSAETHTVYTVETLCDRPRPLTPGKAPEQV